MACNLLGCNSGDCGVNLIWVIILFWLLFFNTGKCSCGCNSTPNCSSNGFVCGC